MQEAGKGQVVPLETMTEKIPLKPLFARVLLRREKMKHSTIILTEDTARRHAPAKGVVVAKGDAADSGIDLGKTYLFGRHSGTWINADGTVSAKEEDAEFYMVMDEDILAEVVT